MFSARWIVRDPTLSKRDGLRLERVKSLNTNVPSFPVRSSSVRNLTRRIRGSRTIGTTSDAKIRTSRKRRGPRASRLFVLLTYNIFRRLHPIELQHRIQRPSGSAPRALISSHLSLLTNHQQIQR